MINELLELCTFLIILLGVVWLGLKIIELSLKREDKDLVLQSRRARKYITNLIVLGKLRQIADKSKVNLEVEKGFVNELMVEDFDLDLDNQVEADIVTETIEETSDKK